MLIRSASTPRVSVLFSEPKIPQTQSVPARQKALGRFSALQRAENSSNVPALRKPPKIPNLFQCSSASRKFLKRSTGRPGPARVLRSFSALQRAENSSNRARNRRRRADCVFQCSSASRKFLKPAAAPPRPPVRSNVSVLFSEPKIPQTQAGDRSLEPVFAFQCSSASRKFLKHDRRGGAILPRL